MGLYDRDYTREDYQYRHAPQMRMAVPRITPVVKWLVIINVAVFLLSFLIVRLGQVIFYWFSVYPATPGMSFQLWRPVTYQFLHGGPGHILINMLVLFFFGPVLERLWGSRKFLTFYLVCGAMGGLFYPLLVLVGWLGVGQLVGASGSILGILAAAAILFPNMRVYVWGIFPVKITVLALVLAAISIITLLRPDQYRNAGGQALPNLGRGQSHIPPHYHALGSKIFDQAPADPVGNGFIELMRISSPYVISFEYGLVDISHYHSFHVQFNQI